MALGPHKTRIVLMVPLPFDTGSSRELTIPVAWYGETPPEHIERCIREKVNRAAATAGHEGEVLAADQKFCLEDEDGDDVVLSYALPTGLQLRLRPHALSTTPGSSTVFSKPSNSTTTAQPEHDKAPEAPQEQVVDMGRAAGLTARSDVSSSAVASASTGSRCSPSPNRRDKAAFARESDTVIGIHPLPPNKPGSGTQSVARTEPANSSTRVSYSTASASPLHSDSKSTPSATVTDICKTQHRHTEAPKSARWDVPGVLPSVLDLQQHSQVRQQHKAVQQLNKIDTRQLQEHGDLQDKLVKSQKTQHLVPKESSRGPDRETAILRNGPELPSTAAPARPAPIIPESRDHPQQQQTHTNFEESEQRTERQGHTQPLEYQRHPIISNSTQYTSKGAVGYVECLHMRNPRKRTADVSEPRADTPLRQLKVARHSDDASLYATDTEVDLFSQVSSRGRNKSPKVDARNLINDTQLRKYVSEFVFCEAHCGHSSPRLQEVFAPIWTILTAAGWTRARIPGRTAYYYFPPGVTKLTGFLAHSPSLTIGKEAPPGHKAGRPYYQSTFGCIRHLQETTFSETLNAAGSSDKAMGALLRVGEEHRVSEKTAVSYASSTVASAATTGQTKAVAKRVRRRPKKTRCSRAWGEAEVNALRDMVEKHGEGDWQTKSAKFETRRTPGSMRRKWEQLKARDHTEQEDGVELINRGTRLEVGSDLYVRFKSFGWSKGSVTAKIQHSHGQGCTYKVKFGDGRSYHVDPEVSYCSLKLKSALRAAVRTIPAAEVSSSSSAVVATTLSFSAGESDEVASKTRGSTHECPHCFAGSGKPVGHIGRHLLSEEAAKATRQANLESFLCRRVKKYFDGYGCYFGTVASRTEESKHEDDTLFTVAYDDYDTETLDLRELKTILIEPPQWRSTVPGSTAEARAISQDSGKLKMSVECNCKGEPRHYEQWRQHFATATHRKAFVGTQKWDNSERLLRFGNRTPLGILADFAKWKGVGVTESSHKDYCTKLRLLFDNPREYGVFDGSELRLGSTVTEAIEQLKANPQKNDSHMRAALKKFALFLERDK